MVSIFWLAVLGEGSEPGTWPEPRELPKISLRHGTAAREQELIAPQNMPAVERYRLGSANEKEGRATGELVRCTTGAAACGVGLASPACCWKRSTMADVK